MNGVVASSGLLRVELNVSVCPGSERMLSDFQVCACALLTEATGVTVADIVVAIALKHERSFVLLW